MATLAYAIRTKQRKGSSPGTSESTGKPGSSLTPSSAFDAQFDWHGNARIVVAVVVAILIAAIAKQLGVKADQES